MDNMDLWNKVSRPPKHALKQIGGGRLKGMTDIQPQWRYEALTERFGPCGIGWYYTIDKLWTEIGSDEQVACFATIQLYTKDRESWSAPIAGVGGSMFVAKEKAGPHTSDECYKMAVTDAISVAAKVLGFGAEVYAGRWDGSKYKEKPVEDNKFESAEKRAAYENEADTHATLESLKNWYKKNEKKMAKELTESDKKALNKYIGFLKADLEEIKENKTVPGDLPR